MDDSIVFDRDTLGTRFMEKYDPPGLAYFDFSGIQLLLEEAGSKSMLYFWVEVIHAAFDEPRSDWVEFIKDPQLVHRHEMDVFRKPDGEEWMAFFSDRSGNLLDTVTYIFG